MPCQTSHIKDDTDTRCVFLSGEINPTNCGNIITSLTELPPFDTKKNLILIDYNKMQTDLFYRSSLHYAIWQVDLLKTRLAPVLKTIFINMSYNMYL